MQKQVRNGRTAAAAMLLLVAGACGDPDPSYTREPSLEYKLAAIHSGGHVRDDDPLVSRFRSILDRLEGRCPESRQQLADMGVTGRDLLRQKGVDEALLTAFENWHAAIPDGVQDGGVGPCADILAAYVTLQAGR